MSKLRSIIKLKIMNYQRAILSKNLNQSLPFLTLESLNTFQIL